LQHNLLGVTYKYRLVHSGIALLGYG